MHTPVEAVVSILFVASRRRMMSVVAAGGKHLRWSSMARFGYAPPPSRTPQQIRPQLYLATIACRRIKVLNRSPPRGMPLSRRDRKHQSIKEHRGGSIK
jgi:hypothetical protein